MDPRTTLNTVLAALPQLDGLLRIQPFLSAMPDLLPKEPAPENIIRAAREAMAQGFLSKTPELQAGIWLYVDDLHRSHTLSQGIAGPTGAAWHAIMHRREGDFSNSKYWWRQAMNHPAFPDHGGHNPMSFVDEVAGAKPETNEALVDRQRTEWLVLFEWCVRQAVPNRN